MGNSIKVVPKEHWEVMVEYLASSDKGVVLIPEHVLKSTGLSEEDIERANDHFEGYSFGGDADLWVDIVLGKSHYFMNWYDENVEAGGDKA